MEKKRDSFFLKMKRDTGKPGRNNKEEVEERNAKRQDEFNRNRKGLDVNKEKKPFDKKAYRLKKYSKKYKLGQWEEQRKKRLLREYHKDIKNDPTVGTYSPKSFDEDCMDGIQEVGKYVRHPDRMNKENSESTAKTKKKDPFRKAKEHYTKVKEDKQKKLEEKARVQEEKKQKLEAYKKKKRERFSLLCKQTKKGQPMMKGRLELMLEKLKNGTNKVKF